MKMDQLTSQTSTALLCPADGVDTLETNSLCCAAAGIIAPSSATAEALIPHKKLREAATPDAALIAQNCPPAQPIVGYKLILVCWSAHMTLTYAAQKSPDVQEAA